MLEATLSRTHQQISNHPASVTPQVSKAVSMKLAFATVFTFLSLAMAVAVPEPAADNLVSQI